MNKSQENIVPSPKYTKCLQELPMKSNLCFAFSQNGEVKAFIASLQEFIRKGEFENLLTSVENCLPGILDCYPKILFWIYKCWFLVLKKQKNVLKAEDIYRKFLFPSYQKSDNFKNKIATFSVILHSQNVNFSEITCKIDKYAEKFLNLLLNIILQELKLSRGGSLCKNRQFISSPIYCENKHMQILRKLDINEDDSCLSDLEDEILRGCQGEGRLSSDRKISEVFNIKKQLRPESVGPESPVEAQPIIQSKIESPEIATMNQFEKFAEAVQDSQIYQPLKNISYTKSYDTWHESRKSSEHFMDVEEELNFSLADPGMQQVSPTITHNILNTINYQMDNSVHNNYSQYSNQCDNNNTFITLNNSDFVKKSSPLSSPHIFRVPKNYKVDPTMEACSNLNLYNKPFIPKAKAKERLKNIVPFLRDFKPRFLKKENIDKKILRKFRNYVKVIYKNERETLDAYDKIFWKNFVSSNLLPPMKYEDKYVNVEFKSFNTKYLLWLFSKEGCVTLYQDFSSKFGGQILQDFVGAYDLMNNTTEEGIIEKLKYYIIAIPDIYSKKGGLIDLIGSAFDNYSSSNLSYTSKLQSEELLASYLGWEANLPLGDPFLLKNFDEPSYRRCGKKITERHYYEDNESYENYESFCNFGHDTVMNASYDSVPSS